MGCWICDKGPIKGVKYNRELCFRHFDLATICIECGGLFVVKSENIQICTSCKRCLVPTRKPYISQRQDYGIVCCEVCKKEFRPKAPRHKCCSSKCSRERNNLQQERHRIIIFDRDKFQCIYCGKTSYKNLKKLHIDHIIPRFEGGQDYAKNLVTSCTQCNLGKSNMILHSLQLILSEVERRNKKVGINPYRIIKLPGTVLQTKLPKTRKLTPTGQLVLFDIEANDISNPSDNGKEAIELLESK